MKKSCHYGRTKWTAIFDGRSYIFMTTISMGEAGCTLRPLAGFWFLNFSRQRKTCKVCGVSVPLRGPFILASLVATGEVTSKRADGGACALRTLLSLWMVYSLRSWRPLRHTTCATSPALAGEAGGTLRPLAGFWFLNSVRNEAERWVDVQVSVPLRGSGS